MIADDYYKDYIVFSLTLTATKENDKIKKKQINAPKDWTKLNKSLFDKTQNALAILTGEKNNLFVIDYDEKENYERDISKYPELKNYVVETNKGFHIYLKYHKELEKLKSSRKHNIDFQGNNKCVYAPPTTYEDNEKNIYQYKKITKTTLKDLQEPSKELIKYFYDTYNTETIKTEKNKINDCLNKMFKSNYKWTWNLQDNKNGYAFYNNDYCCLVQGDNHGSINHSCFFVNIKGYSIINCHSHNQKKISYKTDPELKTLKQLLGIIEEKEEKNKQPTPFEILRDYVKKIAYNKGYKKDGDLILRPLENIPTHMEFYKTIDLVLDEIFENEENELYKLYRKTPRNKKLLIEYFTSYDDMEFSRIKRNSNIYSFNDGYVDINTMEFMEYEKDKKYNICSSVYIDGNFEEENTETPNWDKLIKHHIQDDFIYDIFNGLIGRLFYPLKQYDNWQVIPFLKGSANTGKSTIIEIIQSFFNVRETGSISSNFEKTFGLQNIYDKKLIICPDIPTNIKNVLEASLFQSMVSGETINVPRKCQTSISCEFLAPMLWAGNFLPNYNDKSRSVSRRIAIFDINNEVKEKDTTLKQKILTTEKVALFKKFLNSYHTLKDKVKNITFEDWGKKLNIDYFDKQTEEFRKESDYLFQFITNPPDVNKTRTSNIWIEYKEGAITELEELKKKFKAFLQFKHNITNYRWSNTSDTSTLQKEGYEIKNVNICASCNKKAVKGCCENYNSKNRRKKIVVVNMVIRNEFIDDED